MMMKIKLEFDQVESFFDWHFWEFSMEYIFGNDFLLAIFG